MSASVIIILVIMLFALGVIGVVLINARVFGNRSAEQETRANIKTLVTVQRTATEKKREGQSRRTVFDTAKESTVRKTCDSRLTLAKKLKYSQWKMSPAVFRLCEIGISLFAVSLAHFKMNIVIQMFTLMTGPMLMRWLNAFAMERRFRAFDADYPQFLMSLVGLLKTGMNPMNAIEAAALGLEEGSMVKREVDLMMERLRFGVPEEKSIGSFGEDIHHPEIELFVQALLLSRRVGGTLSDTLDRLARQVRRRQYFRSSAVAAVGMQRGSIWFIVGILAILELYLYFAHPDMVTGAISSEFGWQVWQTGIVLILIGMFWVRQVTKLRV